MKQLEGVHTCCPNCRFFLEVVVSTDGIIMAYCPFCECALDIPKLQQAITAGLAAMDKAKDK